METRNVEGFHFTSNNGQLSLYDGSEKVATYRNPAFCFDKDSGTLLKYGEAEDVENWMHEAVLKLNEVADPVMVRQINDVLSSAYFEPIVDVDDVAAQLAAAMTVVQSDVWETDTINRFIQCTGYIKVWYDRMIADTQSPTIPIHVYQKPRIA